MSATCTHPGGSLRVISSIHEDGQLSAVLCQCTECNRELRVRRDGDIDDSVQVGGFRVDLYRLPSRVLAAAAPAV
jgi:hypothetical protein